MEISGRAMGLAMGLLPDLEYSVENGRATGNEGMSLDYFSFHGYTG